MNGIAHESEFLLLLSFSILSRLSRFIQRFVLVSETNHTFSAGITGKAQVLVYALPAITSYSFAKPTPAPAVTAAFFAAAFSAPSSSAFFLLFLFR